MPALTPLDALAAFLPGTLLRGLAADGSRPREGEVGRSLGVMLFADVSGFSTLAEALERQGPAGAERLTEALNGCFCALIDSILEHGGDPLRFPGDAVLASWTVDSPEQQARAARLAVQCAVALQAAVARTQTQDTALRLRVGIGTGTVCLADLGGDGGRWEFLVAGVPLQEMAHAEQAAQPGQVVLSARTWRCVAPYVSGEPLADGQYLLGHVQEPLTPPGVGLPRLTPRMESAIRAYLPDVVLRRLEAGHNQWLSEFRSLSTLFISLRDPAFSAAERMPDLQRAFRVIQGTLHRHEGRVNQLVVDDKGVVTVAAFGLPGTAHEDDAARAVQAACDIHAALRELGFAHGIGVTSGRVFCGTYGVTRREYVTIGRVVNLAARLMQASRDEILCDGATAALARERLRFEALPPIRVKGKSEPVEVFRPLRQEAPKRAPKSAGRVLVGRREEQRRMAEALRALGAGTGGTILIEGEAGMGKSLLLAHLAEQAEAAGHACCFGTGEAIYKASAYHALAQALTRLFGLESLGSVQERTLRMLERLDGLPELHEWAPLLNDVLPVAIPPTESSRAVTGSLRSSNLRNVLLQLLHGAAEERPVVLMLDDVHWMDSSSWELAVAAQRRLRRLLLVLAGRPQEPESTPAELRQLREQPDTVQLPLERMPLEEVLQMACQRLGVRALPPELAEFIRDKGEGHPFFSGELACDLRDAGYLEVVDGECRVTDPSKLRMLNPPNTVQGLLSSRFDRLTDQQQLTLKVASVIGRIFETPVLEGIYPVEEDRQRLGAHVEALARADLAQREPSGPVPTYGFKHILIRDAAYDLLAFAQRRQSHQALARLYEGGGGQGDPAFYPMLAHHWRLAGEPERALAYLEKAAQGAFVKGANREALAFFSQAEELLKAHPEVRVEELRRASWRVAMATACQRLGEERDFDPHVEESARMLGLRLPKTQAGWLLRLVWELLRHAAKMLFARGTSGEASDEARLRRQLKTLLATTLSQRAYLRLNLPAWFTGVVMAINEAGADYALAGTPYYTLGFIVGLARMERLARIYEERSLASEDPAERAAAISARGYKLAGFGRWEDSQTLVRTGLERSRQLNDWYNVGVSLEIWIETNELLHGPGAVLKQREELLAVGLEGGSLQLMSWGLRGLACSLLAQGKMAEALARLREHEQHLERVDPLTGIGYRGMAAAGWYQAGDLARAEAEADLLLALIRKSPMLSLQALEPLHACAEVCLGLLEKEGPRARSETWARARQALKMLRTCSWLFPVGRSYHERLLGTLRWLEGQEDTAKRHWQQALASARERGMQYAEALSLAELGRRAREPGDRALYLEEARRKFAYMDCAGRVQQLEPLLGTPALGVASAA